MTEKDYAKIIAKNLKRIAYDNDKTQQDIINDLHLKQATVSSWFTGNRVPRMDKIDLLCHYFNCSRNDIMEEYKPQVYVPEVILEVLRSKDAERLIEFARRLRTLEEMEHEN